MKLQTDERLIADKDHASEHELDLALTVAHTSGTAFHQKHLPEKIPDSQPDCECLSDLDEDIIQPQREFPEEIPDSQSAGESESLAEDPAQDPSSTQLYKALKTRSSSKVDGHGNKYQLLQEKINGNKTLTSELPYYRQPFISSMDDQSTQQATQPTNLPNRQKSISEQDESDLICILHPVSAISCRMVENIAATTPQHILQNLHLSRFTEDDSSEPTSPTNPGTGQQAADLLPLAKPNPGKVPHHPHIELFPRTSHSYDIALRMSSRVKDPTQGFTFGRLAIKSDIVLRDGPPNQILVSGIHFRIYVNEHGIIMLQDMSTNGTYVEEVLLQCKTAKPGDSSSHSLHHGNTIEILRQNKDAIRFVVNLISDRGHGSDKYKENLSNYLAHIAQMTRQDAAVRKAKLAGNAVVAPLIPKNPLRTHFLPQNTGFGNMTNASLTAGSERFNFGMRWNGGDKYQVLGHIGGGSFATVYKLATKRGGDVLAAKQLEKRKLFKNGAAGQAVHNELKIMEALHHPHIVEFIDYHETKEDLYIMMEYVPGGDLGKYMQNSGLLPEEEARSVTRQLCHALDYLHKSGVTHRDIKPDNVLIAGQEPLAVKLSDFGLSKVVTDNSSALRTFCGTLLYCAPEIYPEYQRIKMGHKRKKRQRNDPPPKPAPYSSAVDVWSLGVVIYHLISATPPWTCSGDVISSAMCETIMKNPMPLGPLQSAGITKEGMDFLRELLDTDPNTRTTMERCLDHVWINVDDVYDMQLQPEAIPPELQSILEIDEQTEVLRDDNENDLEGSKLSKLSLHDINRQHASAHSDEDDSLQVEENTHGRQSKRFRREEEDVHSSSESDYGESSMPDIDEIIPPNNREQNRLYGEIGNSALRSSGVLDQDVRRALEVPLEESGPTRFTQLPVTTDVALLHRLEQFPAIHSPPPSTSAASSLLGAEAQIRQMNMASPEYGGSFPSTPADQASPRTDSQLSDSIGPGSKRASQAELFGNQQSTPKRTKLAESHRTSNRLSSAPHPSSSLSTARASSTQTPHTLGKLTTVPTCDITTTIPLLHRITTWGREPDPAKCNNTWPDNMDTRIPRIAFDITFWRAGIEREEAANQSTFNWLNIPEKEISTVITTRSSKGISVNGVRLVRQDDNGQNLFGVLRTGDVIVVWEKGGKKIAFEAEIGYGVCKGARAEGETFVVERDTYFFGKARAASAASVGVAAQGGGGDDVVVGNASSATNMAASTLRKAQ